jgi:hypothetical protein
MFEKGGVVGSGVIFTATYNNDESSDQNGLEPQYDVY